MVLTHLVAFSFLGGASVGDGVPEPEPEAPVVAVSAAGGGIEFARMKHIAEKLHKRRKRLKQRLLLLG
jgi:hypothetical protein